MNGLIIGRFIPPHSGHTYLIEYAQRSCDNLYIMLCVTKDDPIPGFLRYEWMQKIYPKAHIVYVDREDPNANRNNPDAPKLWARAVKEYIGKRISLVFASEQYAKSLAHALHARYVMVDEGRSIVPVSGKEIRTSPATFWDFIPAPAQYYFVQNITIALEQAPLITRKLASMYDTSYCIATDTHIEVARMHANRFVFIDASNTASSKMIYHLLVLQKNAQKEALTGEHILILDSVQNIKDAVTVIQQYIDKNLLHKEIK